VGEGGAFTKKEREEGSGSDAVYSSPSQMEKSSFSPPSLLQIEGRTLVFWEGEMMM
jgi:hypothetical protein